mmetsp:Transcript_25801/g.39581  ORF Transcript_25801/g.39581 Transcript_25801/m.39581 type:complete len:788 (+) Transcript_25801:155-2518(+)
MFFFGGEALAEFEDCKIFHDSFSFLMTARYPFDSCCEFRKKDDGIVPRALQKHVDAIVASGQEIVASGTEVTMLEDGVARKEAKKFRKANEDFMCLPFWIGFFINMSQIFIYTIVVANVFRNEPPPNADTWLRLAQIFAVLVTLYTQSDFIDGIFLLTEGWKAFSEITTPFKFHFSAVLRVISGNFGIMSTFVLVMYSTEVVDLLLNFTAMEFVATLDGSAFEIAAKGFLGITLEKKARVIQDFRYKRRTRKGSSASRVFAYTFYVCVVFAAFVTIVYFQSQRAIGVDNEIYVQFDDTHVAELSGISGVYKGCKNFQTRRDDGKGIMGARTTGDIGYVDVSFDECPTISDDGEFPAEIFVYCWEHDGWVFIPGATKQPCDEGSYLLRSFLDGNSADSNSFDILTHSKANWLVNRPRIGGQVLLDFVFVESVNRFDFTFPQCSSGVRFTNASGTVLDFEPLPNTETFYPFFEDKKGDSKSYLDAFGLLYRQVFRLKRGVVNANEESRVIMFDGLRWVAMSLNPLHFARDIYKSDECPPEDDDPDCWRVFLKYFHKNDMLWMTNITGEFAGISDTMKFLTPEDTGVPTNDLNWFAPQRSSDGRVLPGKTKVFTDNRLECAIDLSSICLSNTIPMMIELTTDFYPGETSVLAFYGQDVSEMQSITNPPDIVTALDGVQTDFTISEDTLTTFVFPDSQAFYRLSACLADEDRCLQLVVLDTYGDGLDSPGQYAVDYGEAFAFGSGLGWTCRSYHLGSNCTQQTPSPANCTYADVRDRLYPGDLASDVSGVL